MCGILGSYPSCKLSVEFLRHRGPDGSGTIILPNVAMGHSRLAILDLSTRAMQPKWSTDSNVLLSYNGEIYNYKAIGSPEGTSDTIALVDWLARCGPNFDPAFLDGIYTFGAYFVKEEYLVLCRDPVGIKPLYITVSSDHKYIAFSSEIKGFFNIEWFTPYPNSDIDVQKEFLQYGYAFPRPIKLSFRNHEVSIPLIPTLLAGVYQVCPGQKIILSLNREPVSEFTMFSTMNQDFTQTIRDSVKEQSISDVEVGVQMSGGVDSSLVAYQYAMHNPSFHGFYVSVGHEGLNEDVWAENATSVLKNTSHFIFHRINATYEEVRRVLPSVVWYMDEPVIRHPNAIGIYLLCEYVKRKTNVKVLLTGEGADELFGGYEWQDAKTIKDYDQSRRLFDFGGCQLARSFMAMHLDKPILERQLLYDRALYLPSILARQDRMSMAHSIEARVPFLSNRFLRMPSPEIPGKKALKEEVAKIFGYEFAERSKCGFGFPWEWLGSFNPPSGSLRWLKVRCRPKSAPQKWVLAALGLWAKDYIYGGWKTKMR